MHYYMFMFICLSGEECFMVQTFISSVDVTSIVQNSLPRKRFAQTRFDSTNTAATARQPLHRNHCTTATAMQPLHHRHCNAAHVAIHVKGC